MSFERPDSGRRRFAGGVFALAAGAFVPGCASMERGRGMQVSQLARNKAIALRFQKVQGEKNAETVISPLLAPGYRHVLGALQMLG